MLSSRGGGRPHPHNATSPPSSSMPRDMGHGGRVLEWEAGLPTAAELTPFTHPLIPRALAAAFRIDVASSDSPTSHLSLRGDDDDDDDDEEEGHTEERAAAVAAAPRADSKARKKRRMVWTAELHRRFIDAVAQLGDKAAVPKAIVEVMNVEGVTREHVASHLQKYRVYLKRTRATTNAAPHGLPAMTPTGSTLLTPPAGAGTAAARSSPAMAKVSSSATKK